MATCDWEIRVRTNFADEKRAKAFERIVQQAGAMIAANGNLLNDQGVKLDVMIMALDQNKGPYDIPLVAAGALDKAMSDGDLHDAQSEEDAAMIAALQR